MVALVGKLGPLEANFWLVLTQIFHLNFSDKMKTGGDLNHLNNCLSFLHLHTVNLFSYPKKIKTLKKPVENNNYEYSLT